jgi:hypothetical protein
LEAKLNFKRLFDFGDQLFNAAVFKKDVLFDALTAYRKNASSIHITGPQGRVYLLLRKNFGHGLSTSRIGCNDHDVSDELGPTSLSISRLLDHRQTGYLVWINNIANDPMCTNPVASEGLCRTTPVCVNDTGLVNFTHCGTNVTSGKEECVILQECRQEPELIDCGEDYQWDCGAQPTCEIVGIDGSKGSSAGCSNSSSPSSLPGESSGEPKSSCNSLTLHCSESEVSDEDRAKAMNTRITRAFLGIQTSDNGWWRILKRVYSVIGDPSRFYHTSLWLGTDRAVGFLLHYGAYSPCNGSRSKSFFEADGAYFQPMTLEMFEKQYTKVGLRELQVKNPMGLNELWGKLREDGPWTSAAYGWATHNCQHFTGRVLDILHLGIRSEDIGNPKEIPAVLNALRSSESTQ